MPKPCTCSERLPEETGQSTRRWSLIRRAIRIRPDNAEPQNDLAVALHKHKRIEEAIAVFREAIRLRPDYADAHDNLGIVLQEMTQIGNAIAAYRQAIRLKPNYVDAYYNLGTTLKEPGGLPRPSPPIVRPFGSGLITRYAQQSWQCVNQHGASGGALLPRFTAHWLNPDHAELTAISATP